MFFFFLSEKKQQQIPRSEALLSSLLLSFLVILPKFYQSIYLSPSNAPLVAGEKNTCIDAFSISCHLSIFIHLPWSSAVFPCYADVVPLAIVCPYSCLSTWNEMITIDFIILSLFLHSCFKLKSKIDCHNSPVSSALSILSDTAVWTTEAYLFSLRTTIS